LVGREEKGASLSLFLDQEGGFEKRGKPTGKRPFAGKKGQTKKLSRGALFEWGKRKKPLY